MKKTVIIICSVIALICAGIFAYPYIITAVLTEPEPEIVDIPELDDSTYISISAVGDCTLGVDVNYGGSTSFESEMMTLP